MNQEERTTACPWSYIKYIYAICVAISLLLSLELVEWFTTSEVFGVYRAWILGFIPSIGHFSSISRFPTATENVFVVMWSFVPLYVFLIAREKCMFPLARVKKHPYWYSFSYVILVPLMVYGAIALLGAMYDPSSLLISHRITGKISNSRYLLAFAAPIVPMTTSFLIGSTIHWVRNLKIIF